MIRKLQNVRSVNKSLDHGLSGVTIVEFVAELYALILGQAALQK
jgi:hypothetical protein